MMRPRLLLEVLVLHFQALQLQQRLLAHYRQSNVNCTPRVEFG